MEVEIYIAQFILDTSQIFTVGIGISKDGRLTVRAPYGTSRLTRLVGVGQAKRMILTGEEVGAEEALRIGLVEVVVPLEELEARVMKMAKTIARSPAAAVRFAKKGVNLTDEGGLHAGALFEQAQSTYCCGTEDLQNALAAYKAMLAARSKK